MVPRSVCSCSSKSMKCSWLWQVMRVSRDRMMWECDKVLATDRTVLLQLCKCFSQAIEAQHYCPYSSHEKMLNGGQRNSWILMQDTLLKQEQTFLWCGRMYLSFPHYLTLRSHWTAQRPSINATFSCVEKAVYFTNTPSFLWTDDEVLSSRVLCLGKYAAPCLPLFLSRSHILSVIPFPSLFGSPHVPAAVCVEISGESICRLWERNSSAKGGVCSFPWTLPLQSGRVELGSALIDNVSRDSVATTVGFLCWVCQSTLRMSPVK